ncbi:hypothetical protein ACI3EY_07985 [Ornithinimicrobium sp. LYQ92]|uniref:hypothetical protein n=1 Tax=Serinicoccus sp. LYQ92 TaxID=3378798 RepID=UPI0038539EE2
MKTYKGVARYNEDMSRKDKPEWLLGFDNTGSGLDCLACGARIGARPDLTERHRAWHAALTEAIDER